MLKQKGKENLIKQASNPNTMANWENKSPDKSGKQLL